MNPSQIYIIISIITLLIIVLLIFYVKKNINNKKLTPLASIAFGFILAGVIFGDNGLIGFSLLGIGVVLALIDIYKKLKNK